jgi:serine protease Do
LIANTSVGARIPIDIIRDGKPIRILATVAQRPTEDQLAALAGGNQGDDSVVGGTAPVPAQQALGLSLQALTPELARATKLPLTARGVLVTAVDPSSDAAEQGLQRGDLVMSVNRQPVTTPAQVNAAVEAARRAGRKSVLLLVKRGPGPEAFVGIDISAR